MFTPCSLHCGHFSGVSLDSFQKNETWLKETFSFVDYNETRLALEITGAQNIEDTPESLTEILNALSLLIDDTGRGSIILKCETQEICYFRRGMWKLEPISIPPDPFDGIRYAG